MPPASPYIFRVRLWPKVYRDIEIDSRRFDNTLRIIPAAPPQHESAGRPETKHQALSDPDR